MMQTPSPRQYTPRRRALLRAALALAGMAVAIPAIAQQDGWATHPALQDRWSVHIGVYTPKVNTTARLNSSSGAVGTEVSFEEDLGYSDRKSMPAVLASVRLGERWRIEGEYLSLRRENSHQLSRTINWGDNTYTFGTTVSSEFNSDIFRLSVGYSFVRDKQKEFGVALGLHTTDFFLSIAATGIGAETGEALAPLPTIGLYGAYAPAPKWLVSGRVDVFSLEYEEYDGSLVNAQLGADYRFHRNFGFGAAWRYIDYDLGVTKSKFNGGVNYQFSGPQLYVISTF
jgi:hypothetical protein